MIDLTNEQVIHIKKEKVQYLQFKKLLKYSDTVKHAYSVGTDKNYRTASIEEAKEAIEDYKNLCDAINVDYTHIVKPQQKHTKEVKIVEKLEEKNIPNIFLEKYNNTDGLVTNQKEIVLATTNADCIIMLFFDPVKKVIANTHSGWRGTLQRISVQTIQKMQQEYGSNPQDIICCICPSIRKCHFEVEKEVKDMFEKEFKKMDDIIEEKKANEKWNIDTVLINKIILKEAGLKEENIIDSGICSVCNSNIIHSYRAEGKGYGLSTAIIEL